MTRDNHEALYTKKPITADRPRAILTVQVVKGDDQLSSASRLLFPPCFRGPLTSVPMAVSGYRLFEIEILGCLLARSEYLLFGRENVNDGDRRKVLFGVNGESFDLGTSKLDSRLMAADGEF